MTNDDNTLRHAQQQMTMARPWDTAEHESIWEITGTYPNGQDTFVTCLAITLPHHVTGTDRPLFVLIGALAETHRPIDPAWITHARPLLLVHRDNPTETYWEEDQPWINQHH